MKCHGNRAHGEGTVPQWVEVSPGEYKQIFWCEDCAKAVIDKYMEGRW